MCTKGSIFLRKPNRIMVSGEMRGRMAMNETQLTEKRENYFSTHNFPFRISCPFSWKKYMPGCKPWAEIK